MGLTLTSDDLELGRDEHDEFLPHHEFLDALTH